MAFAARGYDIPAGVNPVTQLHQKEMVLPAEQADVIRRMAEDGGSGRGSFHFHDHSGTMTPERISENGRAFKKAIQRAYRSGSMTGIQP
ncbi:MAG: hypothetical protein DDT25_00528 [Chloroflexi bacterium]|nr:hypothetical protein [Chloroflexota bacterium]